LLASAAVFALAVWSLFHNRPRTPRRSWESMAHQVRRVPFLAHLAPQQLERVARVVREVRVPPHVFVIRERRAGESMYIVQQGSLQILKRGTHDQTLVQTVGPNDLIGEMALLTGARRIASARTITECVLLQIDRDDFNELLADDPHAAKAVWDACEEHTIALCLADHERTRAMTVDQRRTWIQMRSSITTTTGQALNSTVTQYLAVVAGEVETAGENSRRVHHAPDLLAVHAGERIIVREGGRLCWLSEPRAAAVAA
jgi:CRP-like cAMP-binding protein